MFFRFDRAHSLESYDMSKIYVGNLPFSVIEDSLRVPFAQHGSVNGAGDPVRIASWH